MSESQVVEWKESWRDEYLKWICGFANAQGGVLELGRDDRGRAVGLKDATRLLGELPNRIRDILGIMVDVDLVHEDGRDLLIIRVDPYPSPVSYRGEYHYRSGSTKQELKGPALTRFLLQKQGLHWDGVPMPGLRVEDLDPHAIDLFRNLAKKSQRLPESVLEEPSFVLLERLHLLDSEQCRRAASLLFHATPDRWFPGAYVKLGFFESDSALRYQDEVNGPLIRQVPEILEVLQRKYLKALITFDGLQRVETWPVPVPALREAVVNAVAHKDYSSGIPIQISVYPEKLMTWNPGTLPTDWTVDRLLGKHASIPFNPDLANAFFRGGQIEAWGSGIDRMMDACRRARTPAPLIDVETAGIWVTFPFPRQHLEAQNAPQTGQPTEKSKEESKEKSKEKILRLLSEAPRLTTEELARLTGLSVSGVERNLRDLKKSGALLRVGSDKGGHWEVPR